MIKVSIIVPFHNTEKYISECLSSLIYQSLKDIEIICINDASSDKSKNIVHHYAENDSRIILLNTNKPSGQSYARNLGVEAASGKYTGFVDSDDRIELDMFEKLYNSAEKNNADIAMSGARLYDDIEQRYYTEDYYSLKAFEKFFGKVFNADAAKDEILNYPAVVWNKIYRADFLEKNNIRFEEGFIYEDMPYSFETFLKAEKICIVPENLYTYRKNRRFSSMLNTDKKVYDRMPMMKKTYEILSQAPFFSEKKAEITSWMIDDIFHRFTLLDEKYYQDFYNKMKEFFIEINETLSETDKAVFKEEGYARDEFEAVIRGSYLEFWKFLIEKYKTANKLIKETEYKCALDIKAVKDYLEQYKKEKEEEKIKIEQYAGQRIKEMNEKYDRLHENLVKQEYELKAWQAESVKQTKEKITADYEWKIKELNNHYQESLIKQKDYYENHYLLVKILLKLYKKASQLKNKAGRILKRS